MDDEAKKELHEIINQTECKRNFRCRDLSDNELCKARDIGVESLLECLEDHPGDCTFSLPFGEAFLCQCPVRLYLAKRFGK
jgi:hypothetical protein